MTDQPRENHLDIQGGVYNPGEQVEVNENGVWRSGQIQGVANYTVRYTATGRNITRQPNQVRLENTLDQNNTGANTNIMPGSQVEFQNNPRQRYWPPGILVSKNYNVQIDGRTITVPHTRLRRAAEGAAQAQAPAQTQPPVIFTPSQRVEINDNGVWRPGVVRGLSNDYTVRNTVTGENVNRNETQVMPIIPFIARRYIMPEDRVLFLDNNRWIPGTFVSRNYSVSLDDGIFLSVPDTEIRVATVQPRAAWRANVARWRAELARPAQPQQAPRPTGVAHEVHNAFADLDLPKFMTIIRRENNGASNFKNSQNILRPLFQYISSSDTNLSPEQKTKYKTNFRKPKGIIENVDQFVSDHPEVITDTLEVIQFVLSQDPKYKDLYIETFENECMGAYNITGTGQSCTKGMWERIYMANKGTIEGLCFDELQGSTSAASASASSSCKPLYLELYSTFTPGSDIDINDIFQKWYNQFSYDAVPEETNPLKNLSVDARKQHFRGFVENDEAITPRIWQNSDFQKKLEKSIKDNNIIFETLTLDAGLGGRKRRNSKRKTKRKSLNKGKRKTLRKGKGRY
jgi:hypothetical protein